MENPERQYSTISPEVIYKYDHHTNIPWNISEYHTPRDYLDPDLEVKKRKWSVQKKGQKNTKYLTKRGFYMDYELKIAKSIPSSNVHAEKSEWATEKQRKRGQKNKVDPNLKKYSFLDRIEMEQTKRKSPGVCTYSLEKSFKQIQAQKQILKKRKYNIAEKIYFHDNTHALSNLVPGVGQHCPHSPEAKDRLNKTDYKFWVEKHKKEADTFLKRDEIKPTAGTYTPVNVTISTFDDLAKIGTSPSKVKHLGSDARFEYTRENKKKIIEKRPDPSSYATTVNWKGKSDSPKKQLWTEIVWKGHSSSIYH